MSGRILRCQTRATVAWYCWSERRRHYWHENPGTRRASTKNESWTLGSRPRVISRGWEGRGSCVAGAGARRKKTAPVTTRRREIAGASLDRRLQFHCLALVHVVIGDRGRSIPRVASCALGCPCRNMEINIRRAVRSRPRNGPRALLRPGSGIYAMRPSNITLFERGKEGKKKANKDA